PVPEPLPRNGGADGLGIQHALEHRVCTLTERANEADAGDYDRFTGHLRTCSGRDAVGSRSGSDWPAKSTPCRTSGAAFAQRRDPVVDESQELAERGDVAHLAFGYRLSELVLEGHEQCDAIDRVRRDILGDR